MIKNILIVGPTSEIAKAYINEFYKKFNIFSISRKKIYNLKIVNNIILDQTKDFNQRKLISFFKKIKFSYVFFFLVINWLDQIRLKILKILEFLKVLLWIVFFRLS